MAKAHTHFIFIFMISSGATALQSTKKNETVTLPAPAESYFRTAVASNLLYTHIAFMSMSWIMALPICIMMNIARSNLRFLSQVLFIELHSIGIIFGLAYSYKTPDLYPNKSHEKLGWALTGIIAVQFMLGIAKRFKNIRGKLCVQQALPSLGGNEGDQISAMETMESTPLTNSWVNQPRLSDGRNDTISEADADTLFDDDFLPNHPQQTIRYNQPVSWGKQWANISASHKIIQICETIYDIVDKFLLLLGFVSMCTGIVTAVGIFNGNSLFNGLAHFIKGGVFFWYGIITLGRWMGCFTNLGWAWNLKPSIQSPNILERMSLSMEAVESFLIFLYGITNVFLEHLSAWGEAWAPQDFEHVAISLLFFGGGLCGMMAESKTLRKFLDPRTIDTTSANPRLEIPLRSPYGGLINPIPVLIIFLLGIILGGHHQQSVESTMMHKFFGNFLTGASAARCITYLLLYISIPLSNFPSRPPSELITSFCLMCGGIMLMLSNRDTVDSMIESHINAMLVATVTMGITAILMAWAIFVVATRGWAEMREERYWMKLNLH